jgi:parvulin-like peptidyl-prolyl isomerase
MVSSNKAALALLAALLGLSDAQAAKLEDTVATVNQQPILLSEYQKELSTAIDYWGKAEPEALKDPENLKKLKMTTLEELINREILVQEGQKQKIKVRERDIENGVQEIKSRFMPPDAKEMSEQEAQEAADKNFRKQLEADGLSYAQFRERLSKQIMARKLIDEQVRGKAKPPEEKEVLEYFNNVRDYIAKSTGTHAETSTETLKGMTDEESMTFRQIAGQVRAMSSERVRVSRILVKLSPNATENEKKRAKKTADEIRKKLLEGTQTFAQIAKAESEDQEGAQRGGDLGYVLRGVAPPEFEKHAFTLPVGEISEPIHTEIGYNIIRVTEKRAAEPPDFERFKDELAKFMMSAGFQKELEKFIKALKEKAIVERNLAAIQ